MGTTAAADRGMMTDRVRQHAAVIVARATIVAAVLAATVAALSPTVAGGTAGTIALIAAAPTVAATVLLLLPVDHHAGRWARLALMATAHGSVIVAGVLLVPADPAPYAWLSVIVLLSAIVLGTVEHLVLTTVSLTAAVIALSRISATLIADARPLVTAAIVGVIAWLAVRAHQRTLEDLAAQRDLAERSSSALLSVMDAARTATTADLEEVLDAIVDATVHLGSDACGIFLIDDSDMLYYAASRGIPEEFLGLRFPRDIDMIGECMLQGRTLVTNDYGAYPHRSAAFQYRGVKAAITSPIHVDDEIVGVLAAGNFGPRSYDAAAITAFELLTDHASRALALARAIGEDRDALASLRHLHKLQEDFVSTVSHELRTPITVIDGLAQTMQRLGPHLSGEQGQQLLERLTAHTHTLSSVVTSLLELARLDRGLAQVADTPVELGALARGSLERLRPVLAQHEIVEAIEDVTVVGDTDLLERVVDNLLTNAARHTPPGTTITVRVAALPGRARVTVADDGPGIPPHEVHRITERFRRGGSLETRETRGLGLGLALAEQVLRHHGSRLRVRSEVDVGTEFSFDVSSRPRDAPPDAGSIQLITELEERHLRTRASLARGTDASATAADGGRGTR